MRKRVPRESSGVRENAYAVFGSRHFAGTWRECERAYRGVGEKKTDDLLFHSFLRGKDMLSPDDGQVSAVFGNEIFRRLNKILYFIKSHSLLSQGV